MNIFLIFHEKSKINLLRIDSVKKEIVNELTNCKITIFNNTDLNINMLFENNLITVIDKKYNSLYFSCIMDYIIENYETMPDKFIFWPIFSNYDIDNRVVKYILTWTFDSERKEQEFDDREVAEDWYETKLETGKNPSLYVTELVESTMQLK